MIMFGRAARAVGGLVVVTDELIPIPHVVVD